MQVEKGRIEDLEAIMGVYGKARQLMRKSGNPRQWTGGYPSKEKILEDLGKSRLYVVRDEQGAIHACFVMAVMDDPTYHIIEGGSWSADRPYAVIHRIGQDGTMRGVLHLALALASQEADYIRIDTHEDNAVMRHLLEKEGFRECGTIYVEDGSARLAFDRLTPCGS